MLRGVADAGARYFLYLSLAESLPDRGRFGAFSDVSVRNVFLKAKP